jgi:hypothetical protein
MERTTEQRKNISEQLKQRRARKIGKGVHFLENRVARRAITSCLQRTKSALAPPKETLDT